MSAKFKKLLEVNYVVDHDCGNYSIGETDFAFSGEVKAYLEQYGYEGYKNIIVTLASVTGLVSDEWRSVVQKQSPASQAKL